MPAGVKKKAVLVSPDCAICMTKAEAPRIYECCKQMTCNKCYTTMRKEYKRSDCPFCRHKEAKALKTTSTYRNKQKKESEPKRKSLEIKPEYSALLVMASVLIVFYSLVILLLFRGDKAEGSSDKYGHPLHWVGNKEIFLVCVSTLLILAFSLISRE